MIAIFGRGFLGRRLAAALPGARLVDADIADARAVAAALDGADAAINAAGKTGRPNVDWCEAHPAETVHANVTGALVLAEACAARGVYLLHLGSGCVYYGPSPRPGGWREDDPADPVSLYSRTKYAADLALCAMGGVGIARLRMPLDHVPDPRNLITKLAGYTRVVDVANSVTVVSDLVPVVAGLIARRAVGIFHTTNPGLLRHRDLLAAYRRHVDPGHTNTFIEEDALVATGLALRARSNCELADTRLAALGLSMRPIAEVLDEVMVAYARRARPRA